MNNQRQINGITIEKYYNALMTLYSILTNGGTVMNMSAFAEQHNLSKSLSKILTNGGIIKNSKYGYVWSTGKPTRQMALETIRRCNNLGSSAMRKTRSTQKTTKVQQDKVDKCYALLNYLYLELPQNPKLAIKDTMVDHGYDQSFPTALKNYGVIENIGGVGINAYWIWKADEPSKEMAKDLILKYREYNSERKHKMRSKQGNKAKPKELPRELPEMPHTCKTPKQPRYYEAKILWFKIKIRPVF